MNPFEQMGIGTSQPRQAAPQPAGGMLDSVTSGTSQSGVRMVIAGVEKMGKTTLACSAPKPLLVPLEMGYAAMTVPKTRVPTSFGEVMGLIGEIKIAAQRGQFDRRTIIFDTATALERLIDLQTIADDPKSQNTRLTMETAHGGYGKAYAHSNILFDAFTKACDELVIYGGLNIVLTCHVFAARIVDPVNGEYDTWDLLLHSPKNQKNHGKREMATQWADLVGFLHEPVFVTKNDGEQLSRATSLGRGRVLGVSRTPGYVAGNRFGLTGECPIPDPINSPFATGWNNLAGAIQSACGINLFNRDAV